LRNEDIEENRDSIQEQEGALSPESFEKGNKKQVKLN